MGLFPPWVESDSFNLFLSNYTEVITLKGDYTEGRLYWRAIILKGDYAIVYTDKKRHIKSLI